MRDGGGDKSLEITRHGVGIGHVEPILDTALAQHCANRLIDRSRRRTDSLGNGRGCERRSDR